MIMMIIPLVVAVSILLNDFLSLDEHDLLHLETSSVFLKDSSNGEENPHRLLFASCLRPPDITRTLLPPWFL